MPLNDKEFSEPFVQGMRNRMATSVHKYGHVKDSRANTDFVRCLEDRLAKYKDDHNTEWLMDVANFAMMEFEFPVYPDAHFRATGSHEAPKLKRLDQ